MVNLEGYPDFQELYNPCLNNFPTTPVPPVNKSINKLKKLITTFTTIISIFTFLSIFEVSIEMGNVDRRSCITRRVRLVI